MVHIAELYDATTYICYQDLRVPAESIMGLLMLGAGQGAYITIESEGNQASDVVSCLVNLIQDKFGEG
jgi:phosphocarrier protein HPr